MQPGTFMFADTGNNSVKEILAENGSVITLGSGFYHPTGVAVDGAGNVYVADTGNYAVKEIPAGNGTVITLASGFGQLEGVAVDAGGNVYVADQDFIHNEGSLKEIPAGSKLVITLWSGSFPFTGIAIDASGNVYLPQNAGNTVKEFLPKGGYYTRFLPAGLLIDINTGIISGTPTVASAAQDYTVTAYNSGGSATAATATVSIAVITLITGVNKYGQITTGADAVDKYGRIGGTPKVNRNGGQNP